MRDLDESSAAPISAPKSPTSGIAGDLAPVTDQQHVREPGQARSRSSADLAAVQRRRRHQHPRVAETQSLLDRLGSERREQRAEHAAVLERAERRDVQLRDPTGEHEHPLAAPHAELLEHVGEAVGLSPELGVGELGRTCAWPGTAARPCPPADHPHAGRPPRRRCSARRLASRRVPLAPAPTRTPPARLRSRACSAPHLQTPA